MAEFVGLIVSLIFLAFVFLPLLTFLRLGRMARELEELSARVLDLERKTRATTPASTDNPNPVHTPTAAPVGATAHPPVAPGAFDGRVASPSAREESPREVARDLSAAADGEDLEERIGGRGLLYTGVLVLLLGISFFLKYAFDNAWINETTRTLIGLAAGVSLVIGGQRLARSGMATFAHALVGTGFAVLYLVVYAALNFYYLIDRGVAFTSMAAITLAAAAVAHRQQSQALAFIAVGGGFLTPALVGGDENAQLTLFTYDALLVLGTMALAFRHQWPALNALSYVATFVTVVAWAGRFYTDDQWLRTLLFLTLFCVAFLVILRETRRSGTVISRAVSGVLWTAPVFYHLAAIIITSGHPPAIHIYLIAFAAVGLWMTVDPHRPWIRLAVLLAGLVPMFGTLTLPDGRSWLFANVITILAVVLLHVMALVDRAVRQDESLAGVDLLGLHVSGLGLFALLYETLQPWYPELRGALALLVAIGVLALVRALRQRDHIAALNALGLAFTVVAIGIAVQFDGPPVVIGWAAEGAVVAFLGLRARNLAFQFGGLVLWILSTLQLFDNFSVTPAAFTLFWNARTFATLFVLVCGYLMAWRLAEHATAEARRMRAGIHVIASTLTLAWLTAEIQSFWEVRSDRAQAHLYEQMLLSLAWGLYGAALITAGMVRRYAPLRYIGIAIIAVTSLKVFFYDLWELGGIYRVIGFIAFGVLLVLVSYLYQQRRRPRPAMPPALPEMTTVASTEHDEHRSQL